MSRQSPEKYNDVAKCVDDVIKRIGDTIILGLPIAVGKPTHIANEFYRRAKEDPSISLTICSGLTLQTPGWKSDIERRFLEPLIARLFPNYPNPVYLRDAFEGTLPENVQLREIYLAPGSAIGVERLQQNYTSSNFTHVPRDIQAAGCNVVAVLVGKKGDGAEEMYNLGSNADASVMMFHNLRNDIRNGKNGAVIGQVNDRMPYMFGATEATPDMFTAILDDPGYYHALFSPPKEPIGTVDYCVGLITSALIKDGGTFQVGFGSLGDAIVYALMMRHEKNDVYTRLLNDSNLLKAYGHIIDSVGDIGTFDKGLYGCSEFIFDGFLRLMKCGIIKRKVYDHEKLQRIVVDPAFSGKPDKELLERLIDARAIREHLTESDYNFLIHYGVFKEDVMYDDGMLRYDNTQIDANLHDPTTRKWIIQNCLGDELKNDLLIHAGFFVGSKDFYDELLTMDDELKKKIKMCEISFVNSIYGDQDMKILQRHHARFINTCMMATMLGSVVSDTLDTGQVVSGVGGQYNFVCMAHETPGARSIIVLRSTREKDGKPISNIVWSYGNATIPRHLRDMIVTEYGIADLRGKSDRETIIAMLNVADSRFQEELMATAKSHGKLEQKYTIPNIYKSNYPEALEEKLKPFRAEGMLPMFPFGCDYTKEELVLGKALRGLKIKMTLKGFHLPSLVEVGKIVSPPDTAKPYLERMRLDKPKDGKESMMQKLVLFALASDGVI